MKFYRNLAQILTCKPLWETARGKGGFLMALPQNAVLLDVGCGNGSPHWFKSKRPDIYYVGLDVGDYNQSGKPSEVANEYILVPPDEFAAAIENMPNRFDAIVSSHNIEHCAEPMRVIEAMMNALKPDGLIYLSTPCGASVKFPRRSGTLNFFDDCEHVAPVELDSMVSKVQSAGGKIEFVCRRYRPFLLALKGLITEPYHMLKRKVAFDGSTWALYGFESILWVRKSRD